MFLIRRIGACSLDLFLPMLIIWGYTYVKVNTNVHGFYTYLFFANIISSLFSGWFLNKKPRFLGEIIFRLNPTTMNGERITFVRCFLRTVVFSMIMYTVMIRNTDFVSIGMTLFLIFGGFPITRSISQMTAWDFLTKTKTESDNNSADKI
jgi:hypothetical protein